MQKNHHSTNKKKNVIKEDVPIMRSVMMAPRSATAVGPGLVMGGSPPPPMPISMPLQRPIKQSTVSPKMPPMPSSMSFGGGVSPSPGMGNSIPMPSPMGLKNKPVSGKRMKQPVGTEDSWNVTQLMPLPGFHILERTHVYVSGSTPSQVASRIASCLKEQSIAAKYDSGKACAHAETAEQMQFVVRLFQHSASKILVEVQKLMGCSFGFCQVAKTVLNAAKGVNVKAESSQSRKTVQPPFTFKLPPIPLKQVVENRDEAVVECVEHALNLLKSNRFDCDIIAMESLFHITSSKCSDRNCAAQKILCGPVLETLSRFIKRTSSAEYSDSDDDEFEDDNSCTARCKALAVFANCLDVAEKSEMLCSIMKQKHVQECIYRDDHLVLALVDDLKMASMKPHDACQAARCLQSLVRSSPQIRSLACKLDIADAAACAARVGCVSHFALEAESSQLREALLRN